MKLPGGRQAIVDLEKLANYCLNSEHPRGKHKARVFEAVLGFSGEHAEVLQEAEAASSDRFGKRYVIDFEVTGPKGIGTVRSTWIVRKGEDTPRLTSCYVK